MSNYSVYDGSGGIEFTSASSFNLLTDIKIASCNGSGATAAIKLGNTSSNNRFYDINISNLTNGTAAYGILLSSNNDNNLFSRVKIANVFGAASAGSGIFINSSLANSNIFSQVVISNVRDSAIKLTTAQGNFFSHVTAANAYNGIYITGATNNNMLFNSLAMMNMSGYPIEAAAGATGSGNLYYNTAASEVSISVYNLQSNVFSDFYDLFMENFGTCSTGGSNLDASCNGATVTHVSDSISNQFIGQLGAADSNVGAASQTFASLTSLLKWLGFENPYRGWGKTGAYAGAPTQGYCSGVNCQIYDWRVSISGGFKGYGIDGTTDQSSNFTTGGNCMAGLNGMAADVLGFNAMTFLKHAIEIDKDGIGNDNVLCEANESCIYAPNIGAFQGEGTLPSTFCTTSGGSLSGAKIYMYPTLAL